LAATSREETTWTKLGSEGQRAFESVCKQNLRRSLPVIPDLERQAVVELRNRGVTALSPNRTRERRQALPSQPEPRTAAVLQRTNDPKNRCPLACGAGSPSGSSMIESPAAVSLCRTTDPALWIGPMCLRLT